jgi:hypothetical protein
MVSSDWCHVGPRDTTNAPKYRVDAMTEASDPTRQRHYGANMEVAEPVPMIHLQAVSLVCTNTSESLGWTGSQCHFSEREKHGRFSRSPQGVGSRRSEKGVAIRSARGFPFGECTLAIAS